MRAARLLVAAALATTSAATVLAAPPADAPALPIEVLPWFDGGDGPQRPDATDLAGTALRADTDWWALACERECRLQPLRLVAAQPATVTLQYNGDTPGQHLRFAPAPPRGTLLLFHALRPVFAKHPLKAGPVPSGHPVGDAPHVHPGESPAGDREVLVDLQDRGPWLLSPTLLKPAKADAGGDYADVSGWPLSLDLRVGRQHQSLGLLASCGDITWRDYLRWAGDLDGDGRPDFVVQLDLALGSEIVLFLSSLAGRGQFVGEAGHSHLDFEGEC